MAGEQRHANSCPQPRACRRRGAEDPEDPTGASQWVLRSQELDSRTTDISGPLNDSRERKLWLQAPDYGPRLGITVPDSSSLLSLQHPALSRPLRALLRVLFRESQRTHPPVTGDGGGGVRSTRLEASRRVAASSL